MFGKVFTLTIRTLRSDSRLLRTHVMRLLLLGMILWMLAAAHEQSRWLGAPGLVLFTYLLWLNFAAISLFGISYFSTAITEEKEEMTLGLLRMAGINPVSLLLGKSLPRLLSAAFLLGVQIPFTLLSITLGGVTIHQVAAGYLALLAYMVLLANLGLLMSVLFRTSLAAAATMAFLLIFYIIVPYLLHALTLAVFAPAGVRPSNIVLQTVLESVEFVSGTVVVYHLAAIPTTGFNEPLLSLQVISNFVAAAVLFGLSWVCFGLVSLDDQPAAPSRGLLVRRTNRARLLGAGRPWGNALAWKDFHYIGGGYSWVLLKFVLYGLAAPAFNLYCLLVFNDGFGRELFGGSMMVIMIIVAMAEGAILASRLFWDEIRWQTLPAISMLPGSLASTAYSKILGCLITLAPAFFYFYLGATIYPQGFFEALDDSLGEPGFYWFVVQYFLFLHVVVLMSLYVKWGALPVAFAIMFAVNGCCISTFEVSTGPTSGDELFAGLTFLGLLAMVGVHFAIGVRVTTLAAR